ncbi:hypothetical protein J3R83DRAFT_2981, partial [Lanmaoa asiatica]
PQTTSPPGVSFIVNYRSFLDAYRVRPGRWADSQHETINTLYGSVFIDMIRYMDEGRDTLAHIAETGVLPD